MLQRAFFQSVKETVSEARKICEKILEHSELLGHEVDDPT